MDKGKLVPGAFSIQSGIIKGFIPDAKAPNCKACSDTGKVYVDYGTCNHEGCPPDAHKGFESCESCNVRALR